MISVVRFMIIEINGCDYFKPRKPNWTEVLYDISWHFQFRSEKVFLKQISWK